MLNTWLVLLSVSSLLLAIGTLNIFLGTFRFPFETHHIHDRTRRIAATHTLWILLRTTRTEDNSMFPRIHQRMSRNIIRNLLQPVSYVISVLVISSSLFYGMKISILSRICTHTRRICPVTLLNEEDAGERTERYKESAIYMKHT